MKNLLIILMFIITTSSIYTQNAKIYFSNQPFEIGKEEQNEQKSEFTDEEFIYGLAVIDKEITDECKQIEKWSEVGETKVMYFTGTSNAVKNLSYSRLIVENGKTYIFYDISPEPIYAKSRDVKGWYEILSGTPSRKKGKISITQIQGDQCYKFEPIKVKKAEFTYSRKSAQTDEELRLKHVAVFEQVSKMRDDVNNGNFDAEIAKQDEEKKKSGKLPELFYKNDSWKTFPLEGFTESIFTEKVKTCKSYDEGDKYVMIGHDYTETILIKGTKNVDHTSIHFYLVVKDKDGNCAYRKMWARQNFENGKYSEPIIHEATKYGIHDRKEGYVTNYCSCENLPK